LGDDRIGGTPCIFGGSHVVISRKQVHVPLVMLPWRARAEAEGEEEEGH